MTENEASPPVTPWQSPSQDGEGVAEIDGLAWESKMSPGTLVRTLWRVAMSPMLSFQSARRDVGLVPPISFVVIIGLAAMPVTLFPDVFVRWPLLETILGVQPRTVDVVANSGMAAALVSIGFATAIGMPIGTMVAAFGVVIALSLFGEQKPPFRRAVRAVAYGSGVTLALSLVPFVGAIVGWAWGAFVVLAAVEGLFEVSRWKAIAATAVYYCAIIGLQIYGTLQHANVTL